MDKAEIKAAKSELRKRIITERSGLTDEEVREMSEAICRNILQLSEYKCADIILGYYSTRKEPVLNVLFDEAIKSGKQVYLPENFDYYEMICDALKIGYLMGYRKGKQRADFSK